MLLPTFFAAALLHALPQQSRLSTTDDAGNTPAETAEGVEILRRILVDALEEGFEEEKSGKKTDTFSYGRGVHVNGLVTTLWAGGRTIQHARAFHMPGAGLFFALDASLPVVAKEPEEESREGDAPANDEWERARREVRGSGSTSVLLRRFRVGEAELSGEIDSRAIERFVDLALRTLSRHVARIEGLGGRETVTLAIRLNGRSRGWFHDFAPTEPQVWEERSEGDEGSSKSENFSAYVLASEPQAREQNIVLQISVADLANGDATPEQLRRAARVNRY